MLQRICLIIFFITGSIGCSSDTEKPKNLIPEEQYVPLLAEMQLLRSYSDNTKVDTATVDSLMNEIYQKYDVTNNQFQQSHDYYQHFPEKQKNRVEKAIEKLKMELVTQIDSTSKADSLRRPAPTK